jgi:hypothetical protein
MNRHVWQCTLRQWCGAVCTPTFCVLQYAPEEPDILDLAIMGSVVLQCPIYQPVVNSRLFPLSDEFLIIPRCTGWV